LVFFVFSNQVDFLKDAPIKKSFEEIKDTFEFIKTSPTDSVFENYFSNFKLDIPYKHQLHYSLNMIFSFNETFLSEFQGRHVFLYSSSVDQMTLDTNGSCKGETGANYNRNLTPNDFGNISYYSKLD